MKLDKNALHFLVSRRLYKADVHVSAAIIDCIANDIADWAHEQAVNTSPEPVQEPARNAHVAPAVAQPDNTAAWESGELGRSAEHAKAAPAEIERQVAAAVAQPVADEREAFEEHTASEVNGVTRLHRFPSGAYGDERTQTGWRAWQARAALCQPAEEGGKS